jgi:hypothetical protein
LSTVCFSIFCLTTFCLLFHLQSSWQIALVTHIYKLGNMFKNVASVPMPALYPE